MKQICWCCWGWLTACSIQITKAKERKCSFAHLLVSRKLHREKRVFQISTRQTKFERFKGFVGHYVSGVLNNGIIIVVKSMRNHNHFNNLLSTFQIFVCVILIYCHFCLYHYSFRQKRHCFPFVPILSIWLMFQTEMAFLCYALIFAGKVIIE